MTDITLFFNNEAVNRMQMQAPPWQTWQSSRLGLAYTPSVLIVTTVGITPTLVLTLANIVLESRTRHFVHPDSQLGWWAFGQLTATCVAFFIQTRSVAATVTFQHTHTTNKWNRKLSCCQETVRCSRHAFQLLGLYSSLSPTTICSTQLPSIIRFKMVGYGFRRNNAVLPSTFMLKSKPTLTT